MSSFGLVDSNSSERSLQVTEERRAVLLKRARLSRLQWVLQGRESSSAATTDEQRERERERERDVPGLDTMQEILQLLNRLCATRPAHDEHEQGERETEREGEEEGSPSIDLDSLLLSLPLSSETEDEIDAIVREFSARSGSLSPYELFLQRLLHPAAAAVVKALQQFVVKLSIAVRRAAVQENYALRPQDMNGRRDDVDANSADEEIARRAASIWDFLDHVFSLMRESPLWRDESDAVFEADSKSSCEKFVFLKLYSFLFAREREEVARNAETRERIQSLSFLTAEHLDIHSLSLLLTSEDAKGNSNGSSNNKQDPMRALLQTAIKELQSLQHARCPADKLLCLKRCTVEIASLLKAAHKAKQEARALNAATQQRGHSHALPGADELLPVMILALNYANPCNLHSEMVFLQRYTRPQLLSAEAGYLITHFVSAVYFLDSVNAEALTIELEAFEREMAQAKARAKSSTKAVAAKVASLSLSLSPSRTSSSESSKEREKEREIGASARLEIVGGSVKDLPKMSVLRTQFEQALGELENREPLSIREFAKRRNELLARK